MWRFLPPAGEFRNLNFVQVMTKLREEYGNIAKVVGLPGKPPTVYAFDPADIEKIFRNEGPTPTRGGSQLSQAYYRQVTRRDWFQGRPGVIFSDGEEWYNFRRKVNKTMMAPRSVKPYVTPIDRVACDFVDRMAQLRDENGKMPVDFKNELNKWSLESISLVALDARLGCLASNLRPDSEPQQLIDAALTIFDGMMRLDLKLSFWRYITTPTWRRYVRALDCFYLVAMRHIQKAVERIKARVPGGSSGSQLELELSILERLLLSEDDPRVACVMALDMMFAGIDTTASAVATTMYFLCKNPASQERLHHELCTRLPDPVTPLTAEVLEDCRYLRACVKEAMRLRPVAVASNRRVVVDDLVLSNYRVPRGVEVVGAHFIITNSEEFFPRAAEFVPERWLKDSSGHYPARSVHPFAYVPFGFGPRMCIGKRFAQFEIHALLARMLRRFRLEFEGEASWMTTVMHMIETPLTFKVTDRRPDSTTTGH